MRALTNRLERSRRLFLAAAAATGIMAVGAAAFTFIGMRKWAETETGVSSPSSHPASASAQAAARQAPAVPLSLESPYGARRRNDPPREPPRIRRFVPVQAGAIATWTYRDHPAPIGFRMGDMKVIVRGPATPPPFDRTWVSEPVVREIRIQVPGRDEYVDEGEIGFGLETQFAYGRLSRNGPRFLLINSETGGSGCSEEVDLILLYPNRTERRVVDGCYRLDFASPRDLDGDGTVDFIVNDPDFFGEFSGNASSIEPPLVFNVTKDGMRDVSSRPGFRRFYARAARELRSECFHPGGNRDHNPACAAYVAAAARAGSFKRAWADMLRAYDRVDGKRNDNGFPRDLRFFLENHDYPIA